MARSASPSAVVNGTGKQSFQSNCIPHSVQPCPVYAKSVASPATLSPIEIDQHLSAESSACLGLHDAKRQH
jgi:hypothetical protein